MSIAIPLKSKNKQSLENSQPLTNISFQEFVETKQNNFSGIVEKSELKIESRFEIN